MQVVTLVRNIITDAGIFGVLKGTELVTLELNWRDNKRQVSCIPAGVYHCEHKASPKYGLCYHVNDVPNRSNILIHSANFAGLASKGQRADLQGCIAIGLRKGELYEQPALLDSRAGVKAFVKLMNKQPFELRIVEDYNDGSN